MWLSNENLGGFGGGGEGELKSQNNRLKESKPWRGGGGNGVEGTQVYNGWGGTNEVKF